MEILFFIWKSISRKIYLKYIKKKCILYLKYFLKSILYFVFEILFFKYLKKIVFEINFKRYFVFEIKKKRSIFPTSE